MHGHNYFKGVNIAIINLQDSKKKGLFRRERVNEKFERRISEGSFYICVVHHRTMYKNNVHLFEENKYQTDHNKFLL